MPSYYVVSATGSCILEAGSPTSDQIVSTLNQTFPPGQNTFVGPTPRITRSTPGIPAWGALTSPGTSPQIHVAWLFSLDQDDPATAATVATAMANALNALYCRWTASVSPYDQSINGSVDWWQSGQAAQSPTRDQWSSTAPNENPVGPTNAQTTAGGILGYINPFAPSPDGTTPIDKITKLLTVAGIVVAGGTVLYLAWPMLSGLRTTASARQHARARAAARANPSRRRRRRLRRA